MKDDALKGGAALTTLFRMATRCTAAMAMTVAVSATVEAQGAKQAAHAGAPSVAPIGCWRFDTPLGPTPEGSADEAKDERWFVLGLRRDGTVSRPLMRADSASKFEGPSRWTAGKDTITVLVSDGTNGWQARLVRHASALVGEATYMTQRAGDPIKRDARATSETCKQSSDTLRVPN